jgi:WD40 repeat protein
MNCNRGRFAYRSRLVSSVIIVLGVMSGVDGLHSSWGAQTLTLETHLSNATKGVVTGVAWSPDGAKLATISGYGQWVELWDSSGWATQRFERVQRDGPYVGNSLAFLPDNKTLIGPAPSANLAEANSSLIVWNTDTGLVEQLVDGPTPSVERKTAHPYNGASIFAVSPDGSMVASVPSAYGQPVTLYSTKTWNIIRRVPVRFQDVGLPSPGDHTGPDATENICAISFSADGTKLALGVPHGGVALVDVRNPSSSPRFLKSYAGIMPVCAVAFSPDGHLLALGKGIGVASVGPLSTEEQKNSAASLKIWDLAASRFVAFDPDAPDNIQQMSWSADSRYLAVAGGDHTIRVYIPSQSGTAVVAVPFHDPVTSVAFSPVGPDVAVASGSMVTVLTIAN